MPDNLHDWTVTSLREYLLSLLNEQDKRNEQRFQASMRETDAKFNTITAEIVALEKKIDASGSRQNHFEGKSAGLHSGWLYLIGAMALAASIISIVVALRH